MKSVGQPDTNIVCCHLHVESKKRHNELICRTDTDSQISKNLCFPKETGGGWGDTLGVWDGNAIKLGCDDHCTIINVINFIE